MTRSILVLESVRITVRISQPSVDVSPLIPTVEENKVDPVILHSKAACEFTGGFFRAPISRFRIASASTGNLAFVVALTGNRPVNGVVFCSTLAG
ncbi:hypothetical protein RB5875 [Rhodopirellula baltica SH 1]|uniref:Uncharacterized protein n=1 Tax=Rhodopirellula baltica (strain DSM 10527 / NCIMB 13988 / SH1) TaxID=243090 RepID=Q7UR57_RHOBA|nr:hypothetical protein RB5875 [Rhodopirellula baltica SH 1]